MSKHDIGLLCAEKFLENEILVELSDFKYFSWNESSLSVTVSLVSNYFYYSWDMLDKASDLILLSFMKICK